MDGSPALYEFLNPVKDEESNVWMSGLSYCAPPLATFAKKVISVKLHCNHVN